MIKTSRTEETRSKTLIRKNSNLQDASSRPGLTDQSMCPPSLAMEMIVEKLLSSSKNWSLKTCTSSESRSRSTIMTSARSERKQTRNQSPNSTESNENLHRKSKNQERSSRDNARRITACRWSRTMIERPK